MIFIKMKVDALFISDVHLGSRGSNADDVLNLLKRRNSNFTKYRLVHLIVGYLYLSCFFISGFISSKWVAAHIGRDLFMFVFWYMLPLCFFFFHFYFTKKDYQDFISDNI